jgi:hypothetical protein
MARVGGSPLRVAGRVTLFEQRYPLPTTRGNAVFTSV